MKVIDKCINVFIAYSILVFILLGVGNACNNVIVIDIKTIDKFDIHIVFSVASIRLIFILAVRNIFINFHVIDIKIID